MTGPEGLNSMERRARTPERALKENQRLTGIVLYTTNKGKRKGEEKKKGTPESGKTRAKSQAGLAIGRAGLPAREGRLPCRRGRSCWDSLARAPHQPS